MGYSVISRAADLSCAGYDELERDTGRVLQAKSCAWGFMSLKLVI